MRACGRLGVVLHRERRNVEGVEALDDVVVEVDVADLDATEARWALGDDADRSVDGEAVIVARDLGATGGDVDDGLVDASVAERQLVGGEAEGAPEQLISEADTEERQTRLQRCRAAARRGGPMPRVPWSVGEERRDG